MTFSFNPLLSFLSSIVGKFLVDNGLKFIAYKTLFITFFVTVVPVIIKNLVSWFGDEMMNVLVSVTNGWANDLHSLTYQLTGLSGYLANKLLIPDCFTVILTACSIRLVLNFTPFVK
ncbi:MAG: hypothetical protein OCC45_06425 [Desulfotalea sp.]